MAQFVHIADARDAPAIQRSGLTLPKARSLRSENAKYKRGVFAVPVIENYLVTHQWVRELKRRGFRNAVGIYFGVRDDELVWVGRYGTVKERTSAAAAVALLRSTQELGFEVVIPRAVRASEIRRVKALAHVLGWRYVPGANGTPPFCGCSYCQRGNFRSRKLRLRHELLGG